MGEPAQRAGRRWRRDATIALRDPVFLAILLEIPWRLRWVIHRSARFQIIGLASVSAAWRALRCSGSRATASDRSLARLLADDGPDAARIRMTVNQTISGEPPKDRRHSCRASPLPPCRR